MMSQDLPSYFTVRPAQALVLGLLVLGFLTSGGCLAADQADTAVGRHLAFDPSLHEMWRKRINTIKQSGALPIIDTQATFRKGLNMEFIVRSMDELGVALISFAPKMATTEEGSVASLQLHRRYPQYFVPTVADGSVRGWAMQDEAFIQRIEQDARSGHYYQMGEFELRHYMSTYSFKNDEQHRDISIRPDAPGVHRLFQLGAETQLTFQIHHDPEDEFLEPLERMLAQYPETLVIWCHLGQIRYPDKETIYSPAYVAGLLEQYPNLYFDLAGAYPGKPYPGSGFIHNTLQDASGHLVPAWRDLIEAHPDRFTIGSDISPRQYERFPERIVWARIKLGDLSKSTAEQVAYQNAWYLITRTRWGESRSSGPDAP